jgi:hypothetical protein
VRNPFTPTFGVTPPVLVGRDEEIEAFREALADGPGAPARAILLTGPRGTGKTVLLNAVEDAAREAGWAVASATTRPGVAAELALTELPRLLVEHDPEAVTSSLQGAGFSVLGSGANFSRVRSERHPVQPSFRSRLEDLARVLAGRDSGLLVSLDEIHRDALTDLREIAQGVQHAFRSGLEVAFVAAGLPAAVDVLLRDETTTFIRRAERFTLGRVADRDVAAALASPIEQSGRSITPDALELAVAATSGYPFLVQMVGHRVWAADRDAPVIDAAQARSGASSARRRANRLLHEPVLADLSHRDRDFLQAMAHDDGPSLLRHIAGRMGVSSDYAGQYRSRLIAAEVVEAAGHGLVDFAVPFLREYLRQTPSARPNL